MKGTTFICLKSKTDRKEGNHSYRNVNNNNHNNSLLFSRRLLDAAFSSEREWVERVEPHPLRVPFFLPTSSSSTVTAITTPLPPLPSSVYNPSAHPLARNIHWRSRYRLCALRRSRKSRMNRSQFLRRSSLLLFPSKLSHAAEKNTDNADIWTRNAQSIIPTYNSRRISHVERISHAEFFTSLRALSSTTALILCAFFRKQKKKQNQ